MATMAILALIWLRRKSLGLNQRIGLVKSGLLGILGCASRSKGAVHTHDEAKVDVEEAAVRREHEVVIVPVPHAEDVGHHAVPRAALHKIVQHFCAQAEGPCIPSKHCISALCLRPCLEVVDFLLQLHSKVLLPVWPSWLMSMARVQVPLQGAE